MLAAMAAPRLTKKSSGGSRPRARAPAPQPETPAGEEAAHLDMKRRLPPLNALRAFEVAARNGGFTPAARELRVSQGAVSRHVAFLEDYLGLRLFHRGHREARLTREGRNYAIEIGGAFDRIEQATRRLGGGRAGRPLSVTVFSTLAIRWLVPRIGRFHALYPKIDVQITSSPKPAVLRRENIDFTIDYAEDRKDGAHYDPLFDVEILPVCSKELLNGAPPIRKPADLLNHVLLHSLNRLEDWARWFDHVGVAVASLDNGLKFSNSSLTLQAALNGIGVALAQPQFIEDELASGRLAAPFKQTLKPGRTYFLVSREGDSSVPEIAAFREWVLAEARGGDHVEGVLRSPTAKSAAAD